MGLTDMVSKQKHLTPVVIVGVSFVLGNLSVFLVSTLKEMQAKSHSPGGVDMFDFSILLAGMIGSIAINVAAYMNRGYARWADQRDERYAEEHRIETEIRLNGKVEPKVDPEGHLK